MKSAWLRASLFRGFGLLAHAAYQRLERALAEPQAAQLATLHEILQLSSSPARSYREFRQLPLLRYEDLAEQILQGRAENHSWLSQARPFAYEPTSGSSGAQKWIPYTPALRHSFTQLFLCWAHDTLRHGPPLRGGRLYFSVSPQFQTEPGGLSDDSDYLSGPSAWLLRFFSLAPPQLKALHDPQDFLSVLSASLLSASDLEVISVWSPSFLLAVLDFIERQRPAVLACLAQRRFQRGGQHFCLPALSAAKAAELQRPEPRLEVLFPQLKLISCWGSHNAASGFAQLQQRFRGVHLQAKGLLATEAPISFPSEKYGCFLPLLQEVFFEFLDPAGNVFRLHELQLGGRYELVISQKSGLLRYRLGDWVEVEKFVGQTPCFGFVGRGESVSDLVGEKLNEIFVAELLQRHFAGVYLCLIPDLALHRYVVLAERPVELSLLERELRSSLHYHNARELGQLQPLALQVHPDLALRLKAYFVKQHGLKLGDIKDRCLYARESDGKLLSFLEKQSP